MLSTDPCAPALCRAFTNIAKKCDSFSVSIDANKRQGPVEGIEARVVSAIAITAISLVAVTYHSLMLLVKFVPCCDVILVGSLFSRPTVSDFFKEALAQHAHGVASSVNWVLESTLAVLGVSEFRHERVVEVAVKDLFRAPRTIGLRDLFVASKTQASESSELWSAAKSIASFVKPLMVVGGVVATGYGLYNYLDLSRYGLVGTRVFDLKPTGWEQEGKSEAELKSECGLMSSQMWQRLGDQCDAEPMKGSHSRDQVAHLDWAKGILGVEKECTREQVIDHSTSLVNGLNKNGAQMTPWCQQTAFKLHRCVRAATQEVSQALSAQEKGFSWTRLLQGIPRLRCVVGFGGVHCGVPVTGKNSTFQCVTDFFGKINCGVPIF